MNRKFPINEVLSVLSFLFIIQIIFIVISCNKSNMIVRIIQHKLITGLPSASGITILNNSLYIIGDDTPFLYKLDEDFFISEQIKIHDAVPGLDGRISKQIKPDLEAITEVKWGKDKDILIFGSGSKSPEREALIRIDMDKLPDVQHYSLDKIYDKIKDIKSVSDEDLNIEGAGTSDDRLYLLNRGKNYLFEFDLEDFKKYLQGEKERVPEPKSYQFTLPEIDGIEAGFSGACLLPNEKKMIFTASVENTSDWINDGEVLGSFIGIIPLKNLKECKPICVQVVDDKSLPYSGKIESITIRSMNPDGSYSALAVTDNDDGESELLELEIKL
ncbi:MAG: hypothetical protein J5I47_04780 [Vicingus serpentipes]|nr:hypothetical protein [Vicingus serpentipes]